MTERQLQIQNEEWAKRVFPDRLTSAVNDYLRSSGGTPGKRLVTQVHNHTGISKATISRWLSGYSAPSIKSLIKISEVYDVDPDYLVGNTDLPDSDFSMAEVEANIPYDDLIRVLCIMSELRKGVDNLPDARFAKASAEVVRMVQQNPDMDVDAITGAGYRLLRETD